MCAGVWINPFTESTKLWYAEKKDWQGGVIKQEGFAAIGHYTQVTLKTRFKMYQDNKLMAPEDDLEHHDARWHGIRGLCLWENICRCTIYPSRESNGPVADTRSRSQSP